MCGRFTQNYTWQQVHEFLSVFGAAVALVRGERRIPHYGQSQYDYLPSLLDLTQSSQRR
jgi:hypothetical protein